MGTVGYHDDLILSSLIYTQFVQLVRFLLYVYLLSHRGGW
jgi:hypothetical protein